MTRRNAQGGRTSWLARLVVWLMLVSVHTASFAQVVRPIIWGPHGAPQTGFAANGTFLQNGIITPNPHQGLHTLMNISVWTLSAFALSNTSDPNYVQPSLADMATALHLTPQQAASQINTLYVGANPYASVNPPNANTTANMAAYDQILADYAALGGVAATTQGQGGLSIFGSDALLNTPVFQAALPSGQGAAGVVISESIESVQNTAAVANFNAIQLQNSALLGSPIFYSKHRIPTGPGAGVGNPNCLALGECAADGAQQLHQNLFGAFNPHSGVELGYVIPGGQAHAFDLKKNPHFATSFMGAGGNETGDINPRSNSILAQNLAKATSQHIKGQQVASGINFSAFEEDRALFMQGVDLYAHVNSPAEQATLDALKRGTLKPGDAGYEAAQALAQRSFSRAWAQHVEYDSAIVHNRESAHYQGQKLQLQGTGDRDLFQQGLNLYCKSCDAEQEEGLRKLAQGQLKEGDAGYQQARDLAEQRFKLAYENSLMPPPKKSLFKQLVAVVVAAVAAFFIGPAVAGWLSGVIPGATATSAAGATVVAGTSGTTLTVGGALASGIGSAVATTTSAFLSTGIATGSVSQGLKAAGQALKGGLVTAAVGMVAPALGYTDTASLANRSFSVVAQATGATAAGGGSFGQNLLSAGVGAGMQVVGAQVAGAIGDQYNAGTAFNYAGHAAWGCVSGAVAARSGSGCGTGAAGAVVGDWAGQQVHANLNGSNPNGVLQGFANAGGSIEGTSTFFAGLSGGAAAALVGGKPDKVQQNFGIGQSGAENAFVNNTLAHPEKINDPSVREKIAAAGKNCGGVESCKAMVAGLDAQIDLLSDEKIARMCASRADCVTNRTLERAAYVDARDSAIGKLDPQSAAVSYINSQTNTPYSQGEIAGAVTRIQRGTADPANPVDAYVRNSLDEKPTMLAAVLGVSIIDGDGGGNRGPGAKGKTPTGGRASTGESLSAPTGGAVVGEVKILPGAKPDANELRAGQGLAEQFGYDVAHQPTASQLGVQGQRTADLTVKGVGQVDVYTPVSTNPNVITRTIEGKNNQATAVLVQTSIADADMATVAARTWGKPTAQNIQSIFFQKPDGTIVRFNRPTGG
ncbi:MAG: hypothetical protein IV104_19815 [Acidovorax sp.]|nr:hypothetical protein [Acidovorax sp.]